jgi:MFS family permease
VLHAFALGWGSLAFFRGLLGLSEAAAIPAGIKAISEWFPAKERSIAVGFFNAGTSLGTLLAPPLVIWVLIQANWQMAFVVTGSLVSSLPQFGGSFIARPKITGSLLMGSAHIFLRVKSRTKLQSRATASPRR